MRMNLKCPIDDSCRSLFGHVQDFQTRITHCDGATMIPVLYVDDEPDLLNIAKIFLEKSGEITVDIAESAYVGIEKLKHNTYDTIISDYQMPGMDGIEFLKHVNASYPDIPFILFTGRGREEVIIGAINNGATFYLQKGGDIRAQFAELEHKIKIAISREQALKDIRTSRQRMTDIIDHLPDATFAIDLDGKVIAWNRAMEEMTGVNKEQILGTGDHSYALPFYGTRRPILLDLIFREDQKTWEKYPHIIRKDQKLISEIDTPLLYEGKGAYLWFIASPLYDTHGNITGAIESLRDITDRKMVEQLLHDNESQLVNAMELAQMAKWEWDPASGIFTFDDQFYSLYGTTAIREGGYRMPTEVYVREFVHPDDVQSVVDIRGKKIATTLEHRIIRRDGEVRHIVVRSKDVYDLQGRCVKQIGANQDITERKRVEDTLQQSEHRYARILDALPDMMFVLSRDGVFRDVSVPDKNALVITADQIIGKNIHDMGFNTEMADVILHHIAQAIDTNTLQMFEYELMVLQRIHKYDARIVNLNGDDVLGIVRDITERKRAEDALQQSEERYRNVVEGQTEFISRFTPNGIHVFANDAYLRYFGKTREELIGHRFIPNVPGEDKEMIRRHFASLIKDHPSATIEHRIIMPDGQVLWQQWSDRAIIDEQGNPVEYQSVGRDITGRKMTENELRGAYEQIAAVEEELRQQYEELIKSGEALQKSESTYRTIFENTGTATVLIEENTIISLANAEFIHLSGFTREEIDGKKSWTEFVVKEDLDRMLAQHRLRRENGDAALRQYEFRFVTKSGDIRNIFLTNDVIPGSKKSIASLMDITDRKHAETVLRANEEKLSSLFHAAPVGIGVAINRRFTEVNDFLCDMVGYSREELIGQNTRILYLSEDDYNFVGQEIYPHNAEWRTGRIETRWQRKDGTIVNIFLSSALFEPGNLQDGITFTALDITDRREMEAALREREMQLRATLESTADGILAVDNKGKILQASRRFAEIWRIPPSLMERGDDRVLLDFVLGQLTDPDAFLKKVQSLYGSDAVDMDTLSFKDGRVIERNSFPMIMEGVRIGRVWSFCDITDRKRAEEALERSYAILNGVIESPKEVVIFALDREYRYSAFNNTHHLTMKKIWGVDIALGNSMPGYIGSADDRKTAILNFDRALSGESFTLVEAYGDTALERRWYENTYNPITDVHGKVIGLTLFLTDITERKRAEDAIRDSEERYRSVVEDQTEFISRFTPDGIHIFANDAYLRYFGKTREDLIVHRFTPAVPGEEKEMVRRHFATLTKDHPSAAIEHRIILPDGQVRWQQWSDRAIFDEQGHLLEYQSVGRDITDKKKTDDELRASEESSRIANRKLNLLNTITRHDINNQLTVLLGYLVILGKKQPDLTLNEYFGKVRTAVQRISTMIQFTKEYEQIGVNAPVWQDCRSLVDTAAKQAPLGKVMVNNHLPAGTEVFADPLVVKVFYNLMDNAVRYGRKITTVRFSVEERDGDHIVVCEDDGDGVLAEEKERIFERGFGKNTGLGLALSQEILSITSITIRETGEPGKGARFEITVPKGAWRMNPVNESGHGSGS